MSVLKDLAEQLRIHGIESTAGIAQVGPTAITACFQEQVSGGAAAGNAGTLDCHYNFNLTNSDGSGTFAQSNC